MGFKTDQESFWAGDFGTDYIQRNQGDTLLAANLAFFSRALRYVCGLQACIEFGANVGMNLQALRLLYPRSEMHAIEINANAIGELHKFIPRENVHHKSILDFSPSRTYDLVLIKGVLIHINPEMLETVYDKLINSCGRYLLVAEYYNPAPVSLSYRGHSDRLFKRDFAGELLDKFKNLKLVDYGFAYHRDPQHPQDDITWFLMEKN